MLFVFSTASVLNRFVTGKIYVLQMLTLISMKIVGVVLASGYSTRLGLDKLTQELCGKTVIRRVVNDLIDTGLDLIYIVTRAGNQMDSSLLKPGILVILNKHSKEGMSSSIKVALANIAPDVDAVLITNGDMPFFGSENYRKLIADWRDEGSGIVSSSLHGIPRNPVIFSKEYFPDLMEITGDAGGREIVMKNKSRVKFVHIENETCFLDIDTREDLDLARKICEEFTV